MSKREAIEFVISKLISGERNIEHLKREASRKYDIRSMIKNPEILAVFPQSALTPELKKLLLKKPSKTVSGVTPVAVMIKPQDSCGFGCIYCPFTGLAAKSYVGYEPAAMRGRQYQFDPYMQALKRVEQFETGGHSADKCEVIVMGGTFLGMEKQYKELFIKGVYEGLNGKRAPSLEDAIKDNETARHRAVGLTMETRPDMCSPYIDEMLSYGATRVELGVQHADDDIYRTINRGHKVADVKESTKNLKNAAFKVLYHVMPGLPGSDRKKDIDFIKRLFSDSDFRPDMLKIYPTLVVGGTVLHEWQKQGRYSPYSAEEAADTISEFYRHIPKYVRVMRIQRDIPAGRIGSGVKKSNLRELVEEKIREKGIKPVEIRYREVKNRPVKLQDFELESFGYEASGGKEIFLSFEDKSFIAGFLRLRLPSESTRNDISGECGLVRELHVYGTEAPISSSGEVQHHGFGSRLLEASENIASAAGRKKMLVISGVGAREYYKRHGYSLQGPYMVKEL